MQPNIPENISTFLNGTCFILPLRIDDPEKFRSFLANSTHWHRDDEKFYGHLQYSLHYASTMVNPDDDRMDIYAYDDFRSFKLNMFTNVSYREGDFPPPASGFSPVLEGVSLYAFGTGVAFLEFNVSYKGMTIDEIVDFVFRFRSLRNDESMAWLNFAPGEISLKTAAGIALPQAESGTTLCFANPSLVKMQAEIFSVVNTEKCGIADPGDEDMDRWRYWLAHGYSRKFAYISPKEQMNSIGGGKDMSNRYELLYNVSSQSFWGGSQDGLVCVTRKPFDYQYDHLIHDYHFLYLVLLNQRFASLMYIEDLATGSASLETISDIHRKSVELKTRYSFRVVAEDRYFQTIYSRMYNVLELDELMKDVEESNDRLMELQEGIQRENEQRANQWLATLSILAIFSALIDLADFAEKISNMAATGSAYLSLALNLIIIVTAAILIFKNKE